MNILLGIFGSGFYEKEKELNARSYDYLWVCDGLVSERFWNKSASVVKIVKQACKNTEKINFILDGIMFPLNTKKSVTCKELNMVINNKSFLDKTVFYLNNEIIPHEKVKELLNKA